MSASPHLLILASAGTGKTYRLSNRFLSLLFDGVPPERILATTFTRKAAGEILDRVLERLVEACESQEKCDVLAKDLKRKGLTRATCLELLCATTRRLNTFQIRTIDSFFVHLAKLFALDLELPPGWRIADERVDNRIRSDALQDLLGLESLDKIAVLIRELLKGNAGRGIHKSLLGLVNDLRNIHLEADPSAWDCLTVGSALDAEQVASALGALKAVPLPLKADKKTPDARWEKAIREFGEAVEFGRWEGMITGGLGAKYLSDDRSYYKKPFPVELVDAMGPLMAHACTQVLEAFRARNLAARDLLEAFEESYQTRKQSQACYGFSDLPHALAPRTAKALPIDERELDLWFRLDGRIDHLLLDEFQDTAPVQWRILEPIAEQIAAEGDGSRSFFCVGDVKQSIYAFRQAEPRLLGNLQSMLNLGEESMDRMNKSYRSSSVVLDTVNRVFTDIADSPVFAADEHAPYRVACRDFSTSFDTHEAAKQLPGAAYLIEARAGEKSESAARLLERVVERVELIHAETPSASIGILTRTRKSIPKIIYALREKGIDASGEGGNVLTDARAVLVFLSLLHLADFPDDSAAAFHVSTCALGEFIGLKPAAGSTERRLKSRELRKTLGEQGLAEFVAGFSEHIASDDSWSAWDRTRFAQLQDLAFAFEGTGEERPSAFIDHVRKCKVEAPGGATVRVMTVHASKGLEFDAVLLAELNSTFAPRPATVLVDRPLPQELIRGATLAPNKLLLPVSSELRELHSKQLVRMVGDDLCVLYVAMTRAAHRLELIVPWIDPDDKPSKKAKKPSLAALLRNKLCTESSEPDEQGVLWSHEDSAEPGAWIESAPIAEPQAQAEPEAKLSLAAFRRARSLPRRRPSSEEGGGHRTIADAMRSSQGADMGTLVHALLEALEWSEGFVLDSALSHPKLRRTDDTSRQQAIAMATRAVESSSIVRALSREACEAPAGTELEVQREADFSLLMDGDLWNSSIDRLVLARDGDRVVWAEIIDYKTDQFGDEGSAPLVERYRPQLERYAQVVGEVHGLERGAIRCRLVFLGAGEVCTLD